MTKTSKTITIALISFASLAILIIILLNCDVMSAIAESAVRRKTGGNVDISGLHFSVGKPFPTVKVSADSIYVENIQDTMTIRGRDLKAIAYIRKDSILARCSTGKNFVRFGSSRLVVNGISLNLSIDRKDRTLLGARGSLTTGECRFISTMFPVRTRIGGLNIWKDTDELFINNLTVQGGTTDINLNASASNISGYISGNGDLEAVISVNSDNVNVNELLAGIYYGRGDGKGFYSPSEEDEESFIVPEQYVGSPFLIKEIIPLLIPERVKVSADLNVEKARVAVLKMSDFSGHLDVMDKTAKASNCSFNSNFGKVNTTLYYSSPSKDTLLAGADIKLRNLRAKDISTLIPANDIITPLLNSFKGMFECNATLTTQVDTALIPIMSTLKGVVNFQGHNMSVTDAGELRKYTSMLLFRNKNIGDIKDVNMYAIISNNKLKVFPMTLGVDRYLLAMTGQHSFNNMFDYDVSVIKSPVPFKFGFSLHNDGGKSKVKFRLKKPTYLDANLPTFYKEVNITHKKLSQKIENVLDEGAIRTHNQSSYLTKELFNKHVDIKATDIDESGAEMRDEVLKHIPWRKNSKSQ